MRVRFKEADLRFAQCYGFATKAEDYGYTVEWDDGFQDDPHTRWYFEGTGMFDLEVVE